MLTRVDDSAASRQSYIFLALKHTETGSISCPIKIRVSHRVPALSNCNYNLFSAESDPILEDCFNPLTNHLYIIFTILHLRQSRL